MESRDGDKAWLYKYLANLRKIVIQDLKVVKVGGNKTWCCLCQMRAYHFLPIFVENELLMFNTIFFFCKYTQPPLQLLVKSFKLKPLLTFHSQQSSVAHYRRNGLLRESFGEQPRTKFSRHSVSLDMTSSHFVLWLSILAMSSCLLLSSDQFTSMMDCGSCLARSGPRQSAHSLDMSIYQVSSPLLVFRVRVGVYLGLQLW